MTSTIQNMPTFFTVMQNKLLSITSFIDTEFTCSLLTLFFLRHTCKILMLQCYIYMATKITSHYDFLQRCVCTEVIVRYVKVFLCASNHTKRLNMNINPLTFIFSYKVVIFTLSEERTSIVCAFIPALASVIPGKHSIFRPSSSTATLNANSVSQIYVPPGLGFQGKFIADILQL